MAINVTMRESSFELYEADEWYPASLAGIEETDDNGFGPGVKWILALDEDPEREQWAFSSQKLSPKSKLYQWVKAIDEALLPDAGGVLNLEQIVGRDVDVMFEHIVGDDGMTKQRVAKIRGRKTGKKPTGVRENAIQRNNKAAAAQDDDEAF